MRKAILALLVLLSALHAASYGYSRITVERLWAVEAPSAGAGIQFDGILALNNSCQEVVSISTEPAMAAVQDRNETIRLLYNATMGGTAISMRGTAVVDRDCGTSIMEDQPLAWKQLGFTELTEPDDGIRAQAVGLRSGSTLETVLRLTDWVNRNMEYDLGYGGGKSAQDAFRERRGVCVEYSHLFISMARSLGLEARYVSGYVMADAWQPHAWAEVFVPGYGWLPVDPTFGEIGVLDNSHVAVAYGDDQASIYDRLYSTMPGTSFSVDDSVRTEFLSEDPAGIEVSVGFRDVQLLIDVLVKNTRDEYVYGTYTFSAPEEYGGVGRELILLKPLEERHFYYPLNYSLFEEGYIYRIPVKASVNDAKDEESIVIERKAKPETVDIGGGPESCALPATIVVSAALAAAGFSLYSRAIYGGPERKGRGKRAA